MASNTFYIRGWSITLISALIVFFVKSDSPHYLGYFFTIVVVIFWISHAYFLDVERSYRALYDQVRLTNEEDIDFSLNATSFRNARMKFLPLALSFPVLIFYAPLTLITFLSTIFIGGK